MASGIEFGCHENIRTGQRIVDSHSELCPIETKKLKLMDRVVSFRVSQRTSVPTACSFENTLDKCTF